MGPASRTLQREQHYIIHPEHPAKIAWDVLCGVAIIYSVTIIPVYIGFDMVRRVAGRRSMRGDTMECHLPVPFSPARRRRPSQKPRDFGTDALDWITTVMFGIDMGACCNTAVFDDQSRDAKLIFHRPIIMKKYLRSWFIIDFLSTFPLDLVTQGNNMKGFRMFRVLRLVRLLKLARVFKLQGLKEKLHLDELNPAIFRLLTLLLQVGFTAHLVACFWFYTHTAKYGEEEGGDEGQVALQEACDIQSTGAGDMDEEPPTWPLSFYFSPDRNSTLACGKFSEQYLASFYWTIATMLAVGYGDLHATNETEQLYSIFAQLVGAIAFGAVIGTVTLLVESSDPHGRVRKEKMDELTQYLVERNLPAPMRKVTREAQAFYFARRSVFAEADILANLPSSMYADVVLALYKDCAQRVAFLRREDRSFVAAVLGNLKPFAVAAAGDVISEQFDIAEEVMFIEHGAAWMTVRDDAVNDSVIVGVVNEGGVLGEMEHKRRSPRLVTYKGACRCTILAISKDNLDEAFSSCRDSARRFAAMAENHYAVLLQALRATTAQAGGSTAGATRHRPRHNVNSPLSPNVRVGIFARFPISANELVCRWQAREPCRAHLCTRDAGARGESGRLHVARSRRGAVHRRVSFVSLRFSHCPGSRPGSGTSVPERGERRPRRDCWLSGADEARVREREQGCQRGAMIMMTRSSRSGAHAQRHNLPLGFRRLMRMRRSSTWRTSLA